MIAQLLLTFTAGVFLLFSRDIYQLIKVMVHPLVSNLKDLPGPKSGNFLLGSFLQASSTTPEKLFQKWVEDYGHVFVFRSLFNVRSVLMFSSGVHVSHNVFIGRNPFSCRSTGRSSCL